MKQWKFEDLDKIKAQQLAQRYNLPIFSAMLLTLRGITELSEIENFFASDTELKDPFEIKDMDKAVERVREAVVSYQKICVYGDYDCDGVTSTAIMYNYLESVGANVMYYIPNREGEGYGMNKAAVDKLKKENVRLILTVDNGISAIEEVDYAAQLGIDVVITDHHKPQSILPKAYAVVDPHRLDCPSDFKHYSGAGLALKLVTALEGDTLSPVENYADLAALGTIADLVSVSGENRTIIKAGLQAMENTERIGLHMLCEKASIDTISAGVVAFRLAPRINAAGRLSSPYEALNLLITEDEEFAETQAEHLNALNAERQEIESKIYEEVETLLQNHREYAYDRIIVLDGTGWHPGVIGIVSSKITEKYGKPSLIISCDGTSAKGSGRSVKGFSLVDAVFACSGYLTRFGGHPMAVGFSLNTEKIADFRRAINAYAAEHYPTMPFVELKIDCKLNPKSINLDMAKQLQYFEPFGYGNPKPTFALMNMSLDKIIPIGNGKHLRLVFSRDNTHITTLRFAETVEHFPYREGDILDIAITLDANVYQGVESVTMTVKELRPAGADSEQIMCDIQHYEYYMLGEKNDKTYLSAHIPDRAVFAAIYRYFRERRECSIPIDALCLRLKEQNINAFLLLMTLEIMQELYLIDFKKKNDEIYVKVHAVQGKVDLNASKILKKLREDAENG